MRNWFLLIILSLSLWHCGTDGSTETATTTVDPAPISTSSTTPSTTADSPAEVVSNTSTVPPGYTPDSDGIPDLPATADPTEATPVPRTPVKSSTTKPRTQPTPPPTQPSPPASTATATEDDFAVTAKPAKVSTAPDHAAWDSQLRQYVSSDGRVDYAAWKKNEAALDAYLATLSDNPLQPDWARNEQMAYWINAYNAYTVKLILKNYPVKSITDLHGGKPWDVKWITLGDKTYSLNQIENDILRPRYGDARIHFAVNCAAVSCPPLLNRAYTAANLNSRLSANAKAFINNSRYNTLSGNSATVSKIFDWYKADFGDLTAYLNKYANEKLADNATINYQEYDWALND